MVGVSSPVNLSGYLDKATYDTDLNGKVDSDKIEVEIVSVKKDTGDLTKSVSTAVLDYCDNVIDRVGFKLTPSDEWIQSIKLDLRWLNGGSPPHDPFYFKIRKVSDDSVLASVLAGYLDDQVSGTKATVTGTLASPIYVNVESYFSLECEDADAANNIGTYGVNAAGDGNGYAHTAGGAWGQVGAAKAMYGVIDYAVQYYVTKV